MLSEAPRADDGQNRAVDRYPVPTIPPVYPAAAPTKTRARRRIPLYQLASAVFIGLALVSAIWLTVLLLLRPSSSIAVGLLNLVLFWLTLTYLVLPRIHQLFTLLYVPDYFIGRTSTGDGLLGDPVNLAVDGSADDIHAAMQRANWVRADPITLRSTLGIVKSTLFRTAYPEAPVSDLFLFGHRQAFAYQQEVDGNAAQRHHIRFWPTPEGWMLPGGVPVGWLAAGTYDRSVGLSAFTLQVTHKIDADIDIERDYVINTVRYADPACGITVLPDFTTAYHARNGGGDAVRTDGDLPVLDVAGAAERSPVPIKAPTQTKNVSDRELPPTSLLLAGALIAVLFIAAVVSFAIGNADAATDAGFWLVLAGTWLLTAFRRRWAWVVLMAIATVISLAGLLLFSVPGELGDVDLYLVAITVMIVLSVSSEDVREWLSEGRSNPTLDPATGHVSLDG